MVSSLELLALSCFIFFSSFLSASEVALFSLSRFQIRQLKDQFPPIYRRIKRLLADTNGLLVTILVSNEVINISMATLIEKWVIRTWPVAGAKWIAAMPFQIGDRTPFWFQQMLIGILITTPIVLVICEVTPKVIAAKANHIIAPLTSTTMLWLHYLLKPIRILITSFSKWVLGKRFRRSVDRLKSTGPLFKEDDFLFMVEEGHKQGFVHSSELELIRNIFELDDTKVEEICTPITRVFSLSHKATQKQALEIYKQKKYSRVPVYEKEKNRIVGVLFAKDLIYMRLDPSRQSHSVETVMRRPLSVSQGTKLNSIFRTMRQNHTHMVVVTNSKEQAIGIVTMSDLLGEIFGEFFESGTTVVPSPTKEKPA